MNHFIRFLLVLATARRQLVHSQLLPRSPSPSVAIEYGTVVGASSEGIDSFKGIPYALAPTLSQRLAPPTAVSSPFGTIVATDAPAACPQFILQTHPLGIGLDQQELALNGQDEDCLTITVQRPSNTKADSQLPVVYYLFGGGFELGWSSQYTGANLIPKSVSLGLPVIYVAVNYRVSGFGFLAGQELQQNGSTNLGLKDQRLGLESFGGDPSRVTLFGESAGAISSFDQLLVNGGDHTYKGKPLFTGAIMDSGSILPATDVASAKPQAIYDQVVGASSCSQASDSLTCLRELPFDDFHKAINSVPSLFSYSGSATSYNPRPDNSSAFLRNRPSPENLGQIAHVPLIIGDQEDEGTLFTLSFKNITTDADVADFFQTFFPSAPPSVIEGLVSAYPSDPAAGSPYNTGTANQVYPQFKRMAAIWGDVVFNLMRRATLNAITTMHPDIPVWSYLSTYLHGQKNLGTFHGSDLIEIFNKAKVPEAQDAILTYYISFFYYRDPNKVTSARLTEWPQWTNETLAMLNISTTSNVVMRDDYRTPQYEYIVDNMDYLLQ
ncbi:MAG: hypothetical protein Q9159_002595 [Coniocarpon cinnabarinum]